MNGCKILRCLQTWHKVSLQDLRAEFLWNGIANDYSISTWAFPRKNKAKAYKKSVAYTQGTLIVHFPPWDTDPGLFLKAWLIKSSEKMWCTSSPVSHSLIKRAFLYWWIWVQVHRYSKVLGETKLGPCQTKFKLSPVEIAFLLSLCIEIWFWSSCRFFLLLCTRRGYWGNFPRHPYSRHHSYLSHSDIGHKHVDGISLA